MKIDLLQKLGLEVLEDRYKCITPINSGMGGRSYYGVDLEEKNEVFIKFLLFPRSSFEVSRFENEIFTLKSLSNSFATVVPQFLSSGKTLNGEVLYLVTERIIGITLEAWINTNLDVASLDSRLNIFHRVASATGYISSFNQHRDLHTGNIILIDETVNWHETVPDTHVRIVDWGNSFAHILAQFDDSPKFLLILKERIPKEITGSFYCTPPEIFEDWDNQINHPGKYDSWSIGLLLFKLMTKTDLLNFKSLSEFSKSISDGTLEGLIRSGIMKIKSLDHPASNILSEVFSRLVSINQGSRISASHAGRILWDLNIEKLVLNDYQVKGYVNNPYDFEPESGWKHSHIPEYD